jgi:uncharacterized RDD family membrane protein YckC
MPDERKKASLLLRVVAKVLDFIVIAALAELVPKAGFYAGLAYLLISDGLLDGRSVGKKLMGLRVLSVPGEAACSMQASIIRNSPLGAALLFFKFPLIGWVVIAAVAAVEFLIMLGSADGMRLGDEVAKTRVVEASQTEPAPQKP